MHRLNTDAIAQAESITRPLPQPFELWQHYKGSLYRTHCVTLPGAAAEYAHKLTIAKDCETQELLDIYSSLVQTGQPEWNCWLYRPSTGFFETIPYVIYSNRADRIAWARSLTDFLAVLETGPRLEKMETEPSSKVDPQQDKIEE